MNINEMTKKQFLELPLLDDFTNYDIDSIILIPTTPHDSGFRNFIVVGVNNWKPIAYSGKDTIHSRNVNKCHYGRDGIWDWWAETTIT